VKQLSLTLLLILICLESGLAQEKDTIIKSILFHGLVMDASSLQPVGNTQVFINSKFSVAGASDGSFAFYVNRKDTVTFSSMGYKDAKVQISDTLKGDEFIAGVYLNSDTLEIGEVIILPRFKNLKSEIMNAKLPNTAEIDNAKYNVAISAYQGRTTMGTLGDPSTNYALLSSRQKMLAYSKGGIPPDQMVAFSPLLLIPAAYLLIHGLPEGPPQYSQKLTDDEVKQIEQEYFKSLRERRK
jgi:hypothetical protein